MKPVPIVHTMALLLLLSASAATGRCGDFWFSEIEAGVAVANDCGRVNALGGSPSIRRSFHADDSDALPAGVADRLNLGDELIVPAGSWIEWATGANTVAVLNGGGRVRLDGVKARGADGEASRLDVTVIAGEIRVQVRQNDRHPEAVLAVLGEMEVLVLRGDADLFLREGWTCTVVRGEVEARVRRGTMTGVPFAIAAGEKTGTGGGARLSPEELAEVTSRLPFSFERTKAALPPLPSTGMNIEAP